MHIPSWRNQILRCAVSKTSPILFPLRPELWNQGHFVCLPLKTNELVLCVKDTDKFQVLYKETVWDTKPDYFQVITNPDELPEQHTT